MKILREYVRSVLREAISYDKVASVVDELNRVVREHDHDGGSYKLKDDLVKVVEELGMERLGSGEARIVYGMKGEDWVLKLAYGWSEGDYELNVKANRGEVDIGVGKHGLGVRDLFVEVYDWDKISENPSWTICERVVTFNDLIKNRTMSIEDVRKIFPTFFSVISEEGIRASNAQLFLRFVYMTIDDLEKYARGVLKRIDFYNAMKGAAEWANFDKSCVLDFDDVEFGEDFRRIAQACAYSLPRDVHASNIGLRMSREMSPESIVILDYDVSGYR